METKELRIVPPEGYEIDREKSTLDHIIFKEIDIFKDYKKGDFLLIASESGSNWITIFKDVENSTVNGYYCICKDNLKTYTTIEEAIRIHKERIIDTSKIDYTRLATSKEKNLLLSKINELGYYWDDKNLEIKKMLPIPNTWEEFKENYPIKKGECFSSTSGEIIEYEVRIGTHRLDIDKTALPSREYAEAVIALCQLIQLRDAYNQEEIPINGTKYIIYNTIIGIRKTVVTHSCPVLSFKTAKLRDRFFDNFKDLIETAKILL